MPSMLRDSHVITAWRILRKRMEKWPLDKGHSCECIELTVEDNR